jgi:ribosomal protein S18 acetylase RimI-like enzyme
MRRDLETTLPTPDHLVVEMDEPDIDQLLDIDQASFPEFWRFDGTGISEALRATGTARTFVIRGSDGAAAAYVIVGYGHAMTYLQRLAVHPEWQGTGMGRSLVRVAARSARTAGAQAMLLNTQFDNTAAIGLYEAEGFVTLPERLALFRSD